MGIAETLFAIVLIGGPFAIMVVAFVAFFFGIPLAVFGITTTALMAAMGA